MATVRADYDPAYFRRFLLLAAGSLFFGLWFLYDGFFTYPAELERAMTYWRESEDPDARGDEKWVPLEEHVWERIATEQGWEMKPPKVKPDEQQLKIGGQFFYSVVCLVVMIPCLVKWYLPRGTWIEGTDSELKTSWGVEFAYDEIQEINKKKWEDRGIAKIRYQRDGAAQTLTFDDYKYQREPMGEIMMAMEAGLSDEQIVGAEREVVLRAKRQAAREQAAADAQAAQQVDAAAEADEKPDESSASGADSPST